MTAQAPHPVPRDHHFLLYIAAVVLFILAAIFLLVTSIHISQRVDLGLLSAGLACFAAAHIPL